MRKGTRRRSRLKAAIEPIHVAELLAGAGMTGFLSVLEPSVPVPHLRRFVDEAARAPRLHVVAGEPEHLGWFSARASALLAQLDSQQQTLTGMVEVARRLNGGAQRLNRRAVAMCLCHARALRIQKGQPAV